MLVSGNLIIFCLRHLKTMNSVSLTWFFGIRPKDADGKQNIIERVVNHVT